MSRRVKEEGLAGASKYRDKLANLEHEVARVADATDTMLSQEAEETISQAASGPGFAKDEMIDYDGIVSFMHTKNIQEGVQTLLCYDTEVLLAVEKELASDCSGVFRDLVTYNPYPPHNHSPDVIKNFIATFQDKRKKGEYDLLRMYF